MAIQKSYFSTYGWEVPDAYYKIRDYTQIGDTDVYEFAVNVYRNEEARQNDPDNPIVFNRFKRTVDKSTFDSNLSEDENFKIVGYNYLKQLTKSFVNDSIDV